MRRPWLKRKMYAVMCDGIGIIGGTLAYNRKDAISHLFGGGIIPAEWEAMKRSGYRTVQAQVEILQRPR